MTNDMEHLKQETVSGAQLNMDALYQICPQCFTESKDPKTGETKRAVDFEKLRLLLGDNVAEGDERYDFTWVGKRAALQEAAKPIRKTLRPCPEESVDWENTKNLYIEGDNLEVLKLLQNSYMGKVKMIYIDPPYNTGNDFVYHDDFHQTKEDYDLFSGDVNEEGERYRKNSENNGRFHSDWCSMIYSRLMVARTLLQDDGVIFMSIDENEVDNLKKIASEVFGSSNFAGEIIWKNSSKNDQDYISIQHEYILSYVKDKAVNLGEWVEYKEGLDEIFKAFDGFRKKYGNNWEEIHKAAQQWFKQFPESNPIYNSKHYSWMDEKGVYFPDNISGPNFGQYRYDVIHPITGKVVKEPASGWRFPEETMKERIKDNLIHFGKDETTVPNNKTYLANTITQSLTSIKYKDGRVASKMLASLMGSLVFNNPKDTSVLELLMKAISLNNDDIILDFFSGSGSTGHAMMELSLHSNVYPHFVMVQIQEDLDKALEKATGGSKAILKNAIALCDELHVPHILPELAKERIRRAGKKILEEQKAKQGDLFAGEQKSIDVGFRVFKCADSNMKDVYYTPADYSQQMLFDLEDNVKEDRNDLDLLFGCMLDWGVTLDLPLRTEKVGGITIHVVNEGDLVACFDQNIPESAIDHIASLLPMRVVLRDSCFKEAKEKMNFFEIFKQRTGWSEEEVRKNVKVI